MAKKKQTVEEIIDLAVSKAVGAGREINYYAATENILENYPRLKATVESFDQYVEDTMSDIEKRKSTSITSFSAGGTFKDKEELSEERLHERAKSFEKTRDQLFIIENAIERFRLSERFKVIEMYYFNQNKDGSKRKDDDRWTLAEIAEELGKNEKTIRLWRTKMVRDISVVLFCIPAAIGNNDLTRRKKA